MNDDLRKNCLQRATGDALKRTLWKAVLLTLLCFSSPSSPGLADGPRTTIRYPLGNGTRLIVRRNIGSEIVSVAVLVLAGPALELEGQDGITNFLAKMLLRGTTTRKAEEVAIEFDACGAEVKAGTEWDYLILTLRVPRHEYRTALKLLSDCLFDPVFDENEIEVTRKKILGDIAKTEDSMYDSTVRIFNATHYGDHPYNKPLLGTTETIGSLTKNNLILFFKEYIRPENTMISFVGDVPIYETLEFMRTFYGRGPKSGASPRTRLYTLLTDGGRLSPQGGESVIVTKKREQTFILAGITAPPVDHKDYPVLKVIDFLLGGGMSSRLFVNLRDRRSLGYDVSSSYPIKKGPSTFILYGGCAPEKEIELMSGMIEEARRLREEPVDEEELSRAKAKLKGNLALRNQVSLSLAESMGMYELFGIGHTFTSRLPELVENVSADDILQAARLYFQPDRWTIVITRGQP